MLDHLATLEEGDKMLRARVNTLRITITEVTLHSLSAIRFVINTSVRTGQRTESATQAFGLVNPYNAVVRIFCNSPGRAVLFAGRLPALITRYGRMKAYLRQMHGFDPGAARLLVLILTFFLAQKAVRRTNGIFDLECIMKRFHIYGSPNEFLKKAVTILACHSRPASSAG
jgi:hypothetical protein